jgi:hypothetical protein
VVVFESFRWPPGSSKVFVRKKKRYATGVTWVFESFQSQDDEVFVRNLHAKSYDWWVKNARVYGFGDPLFDRKGVDMQRLLKKGIFVFTTIFLLVLNIMICKS